MRVLIIALLAAISYAQTDAAAGGAAQGMMNNPMMYGMYDELMDFGDMYPEVGDLYDNFMPMMAGMNFGGASSGGAAGAGGADPFGLGALGTMPFMGGDINDIMSDVVDNMKDGDMMDVMENLAPMMGMPGLAPSQIMQNGMPNLAGIMQGLSPYLAMDGDFYGDFGDLYNFGSDLFEDYFKYGGMGGMSGMGGQGAAAGGMPSMASIMAMMGESPTLRKTRLRNKLRRRHSNRLLKKTHAKRKLRHTREFPWYLFANKQAQQSSSGQQSGSQSTTPLWGFDAPDSEDIANFIMMGGNRNLIPPPLDGIDMEDLWMYRGTRFDPMAMFQKATQSTSTDGAQQSNGMMPWMYALLSGLQKAHMQKKY